MSRPSWTGGLAGTYPEMVGEPYRDGSGRFYTPLVREPVFVYGGDGGDLARVHQRALGRTLRIAIYTAQLFKTSNDIDNRVAVAERPTEALDLVGIGIHGKRKIVGKVIDGLKFFV